MPLSSSPTPAPADEPTGWRAGWPVYAGVLGLVTCWIVLLTLLPRFFA